VESLTLKNVNRFYEALAILEKEIARTLGDPDSACTLRAVPAPWPQATNRDRAADPGAKAQ
jgi:hypothetical protein